MYKVWASFTHMTSHKDTLLHFSGGVCVKLRHLVVSGILVQLWSLGTSVVLGEASGVVPGLTSLQLYPRWEENCSACNSSLLPWEIDLCDSFTFNNQCTVITASLTLYSCKGVGLYCCKGVGLLALIMFWEFCYFARIYDSDFRALAGSFSVEWGVLIKIPTF